MARPTDTLDHDEFGRLLAWMSFRVSRGAPMLPRSADCGPYHRSGLKRPTRCRGRCLTAPTAGGPDGE